MHANEVIWHGENVKTRWDASYRYCIVRNVIHNDVNIYLFYVCVIRNPRNVLSTSPGMLCARF